MNDSHAYGNTMAEPQSSRPLPNVTLPVPRRKSPPPGPRDRQRRSCGDGPGFFRLLGAFGYNKKASEKCGCRLPGSNIQAAPRRMAIRHRSGASIGH